MVIMPRHWLALLPGAFLLGCGTAQNGAMVDAYKHLEAGDCAQVYECLTRAEGYRTPDPSLRAEIALIRAICQEREGKLREAVVLYEYIVINFRDTRSGQIAEARLFELAKKTMRRHRPPDDNDATSLGI